MPASYHIGNYIPVSQVGFAPFNPVLPHELPSIASVFPSTQFNKMLNIPGQNLYTIYRSGGQYQTSQTGQR